VEQQAGLNPVLECITAFSETDYTAGRRGQSTRQMARKGVVSRRTATRYIEAAQALGLEPSSELTDEAVPETTAPVQTRPTPDQCFRSRRNGAARMAR